MARAPKSISPADEDPDAGADSDPDAGADAGGDDSDSSVLVTICRGPDGGYVVYAGDEPDDDAGDSGEGESADDAALGGAGAGAGGGDGAAAGAGAADLGGAGAAGAAGGAGGASAAGEPVTSIGAALKAALDILNEDASSAGAEGSSADQFAAGFGADQAPTPASGRPTRGLKYPPAAG